MFKKLLKNKWLIRSIGIIIFILILIFKIDFEKLLQIVRIDYHYLAGAFIVLLVSSIIRPIRWQYILKKLNINYSFKKTYWLYYIGVLMGNVTPGKIGEFGKIAYLKKDGNTTSNSLISIIIDKIIDLIFLVIVSGIGIIVFYKFLKIDILPTLIIILIASLLLIIIIKTRAYKTLIERLHLSGFIKELKLYKFKNYFYIFLLTIFYWLSHYVIFFLLARSIGIDQLSFINLALSITMTGLIVLLPISILGIGTRDISLLFLFSFFGVTPEVIISFSILGLGVIVINSLMGLICWLIKPT